MKAAVFHEKGAPVIVEDVGIADPGEGEVLIAIQSAGLCHSDISAINGTYGIPTPTVIGHEGSGFVESVGAGVRSVKEGDAVVISTLANCGHCPACDTGHPTLCYQPPGPRKPFTFRGEPAFQFANASTFTEKTLVPESSAIPVPKEIPMAQAALIGCGIITGVGAVLNRAKVEAGDTMAVFWCRRYRAEHHPRRRSCRRDEDHRRRPVALEARVGAAVRRDAHRRRSRGRRG